jgi:DNA-binding NtrC family response regulator
MNNDTTISRAPDPGHSLAPRAYFLVIRPETSALFPLPPLGQLLVGRAPEADLRIDDQSASRLHARIVIDRDGVRVRDLGSRNRTWVNGEALTGDSERRIVSGDVVVIGSLTLVLHRAGESEVGSEVHGSEIAPVLIDLDGSSSLICDPAMVRVYELLRRLSRSTLPVLIIGETGTGKENAAQAVHAFSPRKAGPLLTINCAAIPENLFESELFGHVRGAFSGAIADKLGRLEAASGGTVFLDEIGELPLAAQAKLLRALETGMVSPVGSLRDRKIDCRVVAATNRDLEDEVGRGRFRQDLYFRLAAAMVVLPPLRERRAEIAPLAELFLKHATSKLDRGPLQLGPATLATLRQHPFPGNVRELRNLMDYCAATVVGDVIAPEHLPPRFLHGAAASSRSTSETAPSATSSPAGGPAGFRRIADEVQELESRRMREALDESGGNQRRAAELIGMPLRTFVTKLKQYGLRDK